MMNQPEDFEKNEQKTAEDVGCDSKEIDPVTEGKSAPIDPEIFAQSVQNGPQWYGVAYPGQDRPIYTDYSEIGKPRVKESKQKKVVLITVCVILVVALALLAGLGGAYLYQNIKEALAPSNTDLGDPPSLDIGEHVYPTTGNDTYNYSAVVIEKNDGSALADSATGSAGENGMSLIAVTAAVKNSVVEIMTTVSSGYGSMSAGAGSGVIIHADGVIVTNHHVIEGAQKVYVRLTNGNTYEATVRGSDEDGDIAIIKIVPQETLTVAKLGYSGALAEGEEVLAIGNPLGELGGTVTNGIISSVEREVQVGEVTMTLLQTNAAINSGNSGGGLFNLAGELIGIVNAKYAATGVEGLGFAIPIDTAMVSIKNLLNLGYIPDIPSIGITLAEGSVRETTWPYGYRAVVYVYDAGDHEQFQKQDIIVSIDGTSVSTLSEVKRLVRSHKVGDTLAVVVQRNGQNVTLNVALVEYVP